MDALVYILFSCLDGFAIFFFAFGSFKLELKDYRKEIIITSIVISTGTYFFSENDFLSNISPFITIILFMSALVFFFRISIISALRVAALGFAVQTFISLAVASLACWGYGLDLSELKDEVLLKYICQFTANLLTILTSLILRKRKLWITNLPFDYTYTFKATKGNLILAAFSIMTILFVINLANIHNVYLSFIFWGLVVLNLSLMEIRKEMRHYNDR